MIKYNHKRIEKKWQKLWDENNLFKAEDKSTKKKFYGLIEFPYPSGDGLHTGHLRSNTAMDIICRKRRMEGYNVLYPIGFDSFGLPTENYAIKTKKKPQEVTKKNIKVFARQLKETGFSFDWSRSFSTTDKEYYKWTQWIFIQMFKHGLAEKKIETINWCTRCKIGLANEEVVSGLCERCGSAVIKKNKDQWILKITKYADRLIQDLDRVDYLKRIKTQQINWIGKSVGAEIKFKIKNIEEEIIIFTTRPDTLFGATFIVLAPEHELIQKLKGKIGNLKDVQGYIDKAIKKSDQERADISKGKTGIALQGVKAINPVNNKEIPIWVADYVMSSYGTGAIMAVPAHDVRDYEFAKKYGIKIIEVIKGGDIKKEAFTETNKGELINSGQFNGLTPFKASSKIVQWLKDKKIGKESVNYKLHDWIFSRQRYWGEPIPMIKCEKCGWINVDEKDLPVELPKIDNYIPTDEGESPLAKVKDWVKVTCHKCGRSATRETDVMPNWAGSNWYFLRYTDAKNNKSLADKKKLKYWIPVDWYNGGMEHTTLHLLYSRFVYKFLYDIGVVPKECGSEPYKKRTAHGMILGEGGIKMSKSKGNVINPDGYIDKYGADTIRMYEMFMGPFDQSIAWDDKGVVGVYRFLVRIWKIGDRAQDDKKDNDKINRIMEQTIKKVSEDIENMRFNTAVAQMMIFINEIEKQEVVSKNIFKRFLLLLYPFAPHIAEELWNIIGQKGFISQQGWPDYSVELIKEKTVEIVVQVNGKVRDKFTVSVDEDEENIKEKTVSRKKVIQWIDSKKIKKIIYIKNKLINIVV